MVHFTVIVVVVWFSVLITEPALREGRLYVAVTDRCPRMPNAVARLGKWAHLSKLCAAPLHVGHESDKRFGVECALPQLCDVIA